MKDELISLAKARELLGMQAKSISDEEVKAILESLTLIAKYNLKNTGSNK